MRPETLHLLENLCHTFEQEFTKAFFNINGETNMFAYLF